MNEQSSISTRQTWEGDSEENQQSGAQAAVRTVGECQIQTLAHKRQLGYAVEKLIRGLRAELATLRATRDADHGAAIEAAVEQREDPAAPQPATAKEATVRSFPLTESSTCNVLHALAILPEDCQKIEAQLILAHSEIEDQGRVIVELQGLVSKLTKGRNEAIGARVLADQQTRDVSITNAKMLNEMDDIRQQRDDAMKIVGYVYADGRGREFFPQSPEWENDKWQLAETLFNTIPISQ